MTHEEKKQTLVNLVNDNVVPPEIRAEWMNGKTESEAFLLVLDYLFPETEQAFPKWKTFDQLPDNGRTICAIADLRVYTGQIARIRGKDAFFDDLNNEYYGLSFFDGWMYEEEFQKLINLGL